MKIISNGAVPSPQIELIGITHWRLVPQEPRHNTFHNSLYSESLNSGAHIKYFGLENNEMTNWIIPIWPDSVLKRFPYLNIKAFNTFASHLEELNGKPVVIYIFEGTISWMLLLSVYLIRFRNATLVCNLFSSSKYNDVLLGRNGAPRFKYRIFLQLFSKFPRIILTFDTSIMKERANLAFKADYFHTFPVTSSFPFQQERRVTPQHMNTLVNIRSFPKNELHQLLANSCKECTFTFPRGPLAEVSLKSEFSKYANAKFDESNISVAEYMDYFDQFDHIIFLYKPSLDASGKLLDAISRGISVSVPSESEEWVKIARMWGRSHNFSWGEMESIREAFCHPEISEPEKQGEPDFTPRNTLLRLQSFSRSKLLSKMNSSLGSRIGTQLCFSTQKIFSQVLSTFFSLYARLKN